MTLSRRGLIGAIICAPAIVRASSLMALPRPRRWTDAEAQAWLLEEIAAACQVPMRMIRGDHIALTEYGQGFLLTLPVRVINFQVPLT